MAEASYAYRVLNLFADLLDYIHHLLRYLRDMFQLEILKSDDLPADLCPNLDAYKILKEDFGTFMKLAQQTAQISASDSVVYDSFGPEHPIQFKTMSDSQVDQIKRQVGSFNVRTRQMHSAALLIR